MKEGTDTQCSASTGIWDLCGLDLCGLGSIGFYVGKRWHKVLNCGSLWYFTKVSLAAFTDNSEYNLGSSANPADLSRFKNWMFSADQ